jgi:hypothetical protein
VARGWQGERVALTGVVLRQRRVKVPELALRIPGAVLAEPRKAAAWSTLTVAWQLGLAAPGVIVQQS